MLDLITPQNQKKFKPSRGNETNLQLITESEGFNLHTLTSVFDGRQTFSCAAANNNLKKGSRQGSELIFNTQILMD